MQTGNQRMIEEREEIDRYAEVCEGCDQYKQGFGCETDPEWNEGFVGDHCEYKSKHLAVKLGKIIDEIHETGLSLRSEMLRQMSEKVKIKIDPMEVFFLFAFVLFFFIMIAGVVSAISEHCFYN